MSTESGPRGTRSVKRLSSGCSRGASKWQRRRDGVATCATAQAEDRTERTVRHGLRVFVVLEHSVSATVVEYADVRNAPTFSDPIV
jgi:hypothetical protein